MTTTQQCKTKLNTSRKWAKIFKKKKHQSFNSSRQNLSNDFSRILNQKPSFQYYWSLSLSCVPQLESSSTAETDKKRENKKGLKKRVYNYEEEPTLRA